MTTKRERSSISIVQNELSRFISMDKAKTLPIICPSNAYYGKMTEQRYVLFLKITTYYHLELPFPH